MPRTTARARLHAQPLEDRTAPAVVFSVTTTADAGVGSLRQAILDANATPGADAIHFAVGNGVQSIAPTSALPSVTESVILDGTTQPGFAGTPIIELNGIYAGAGVSGLTFTAGNSTVRGLVVVGFNFNGVHVTGPGASGNVIAGNYIGTTASGTAAVGNRSGILIDDGASNTTVGGTAAGDGNLISGNAFGVWINEAHDNTVAGNRIGTDVTGTAAMGGSDTGVYILNNSTRNTVGGLTPAARNILSGLKYGGVEIDRAGAAWNVVQGNYIGTDITGSFAVPNGYGIWDRGSDNLIGGEAAGAGNVISGSTTSGIYILSNTRFQGNLVGTDATGMYAIPNVIGVEVYGSTSLIGGTTPGARNIISGNVLNGIYAHGATAQGNYIGLNKAGTAAVPNGTGVVNVAGDLTLGGSVAGAGNVISGSHSHGVVLTGNLTEFATIAGNLIGTDAAGMTAVPNGQTGIVIRNIGSETVHIRIGTDGDGIGDEHERNIISGNRDYGMDIDSTNAASVSIAGNYIGTNADGTAAIGNGSRGGAVSLYGNTPVTLGGTNPVYRNVISGNNTNGVLLGPLSSDSMIQGNYIGTNAAGTAALPNQGNGILLSGATDLTVGGTVPGSGNLISGNTGAGVEVGDAYYVVTFSRNNTIVGNRLGTDATGTQPLGNGVGVRIAKATGTTVTGNVIRWNAGSGITSTPSARVIDSSFGYNLGNQFVGNVIADNGGIGIDLDDDGITANDTLDADIGANGLQNFPVITSALGGASTTVSGTLHSTPNVTFTLDFYANAAADPSGHGEGGRYLGSWTVTTNASGNASFTATGLAATVVGEVVTATATGADGTSEFSGESTPVYNSPPTADAGGPYTVAEGESITLSGSGSDPDQAANTLTYEWDLDNDGQFDDATGTNPTFSAVGLDGYAGASRTVRLRVTDSSGVSEISTATVNVANVNPTPAIDSVSGVRVEGTAVSVTGSASDPAGALDTLTLAWAAYKNGSATPFATGGNSPSFAFTPNDNGSYRIVLTVSDEDGGSATTEQTVNVANAAPIATISGPTTGQQGAGLAFGSSVTDHGAADTAAGFTRLWHVSRGGTPIDLTGVPTTGTTFAFTPTEAGTYTVSLTATDKDGGVGTVSRTVVVSATSGVTLTGGVLTVVGTACDDDIVVNPGGGAPEIKVKLNGVQTTWVGVTRIVVYAYAGDDRVQIAGGVTLPVTAFGGTGDDRLKAGGGPSVLVGGDGDDSLLGGSGRDVLIGGRGADLIGGNGADDLLIAGYTTFDANLTALDLIRAEWNSARSFADRVGNLSGTDATGVNGPTVLSTAGAARTVFDDAAVDRLTGDAGNDWFVFNNVGGVYVDHATDLTAFEGLFDADL